MERTQIYLPKQLKIELHTIAAVEQSNLSELLRQAGQKLVEEHKKQKRSKDKEFKRALDRCFGIWKDRDPKEFEEIRRSADRKFPGWND
ncbi:MAG: hypothetical protein LW823_08280 [Rickettsiales bacterium]|jgi:hypothetical protein|nr:hypothetical protein [Rickettsiales bacterium]